MRTRLSAILPTTGPPPTAETPKQKSKTKTNNEKPTEDQIRRARQLPPSTPVWVDWSHRKAGDNWAAGTIITRLGNVRYEVDVDGEKVHAHIDQLRRRDMTPTPKQRHVHFYQSPPATTTPTELTTATPPPPATPTTSTTTPEPHSSATSSPGSGEVSFRHQTTSTPFKRRPGRPAKDPTAPTPVATRRSQRLLGLSPI